MVVTATGRDRPGFVEKVTEVIRRHEGNVEASRMARLSGDFAMLALVSLPAQAVSSLSAGLRRLEKAGEFHLQLRLTEGGDQDRYGGHVAYALRVNGADHLGIVHAVSRYLAEQGINIERMDTAVEEAPMSGAPLFSMAARVYVPDGITPEAFAAALEELGHQLAVDTEVEALSE
jgi:glycine cleavage system transcriptional repressor